MSMLKVMWKRWKSGWQKTCGKSKIHQNLSINNIDNRQINAIIESTKESIVNRKEEGKMKVRISWNEIDSKRMLAENLKGLM